MAPPDAPESKAVQINLHLIGIDETQVDRY
jgi:hypothetical protein